MVKIELREDGETLVFHTMIWEGFQRKFVVKIRDISKHSSPESLLSVMEESANGRDQFHY